MPARSISEFRRSSQMRYLRVCLGSEAGDPGMTVYEVDEGGWVHRQIQLSSDGTRFAPEDILMCSPVNADAMSQHPAAEEMEETEFELLWCELQSERDFHGRVPDVELPWHGQAEHGPRTFDLQWLPGGHAPTGWLRVPGFSRLFVEGDRTKARAACAAIFVDTPIEWSALAAIAA